MQHAVGASAKYNMGKLWKTASCPDRDLVVIIIYSKCACSTETSLPENEGKNTYNQFSSLP